MTERSHRGYDPDAYDDTDTTENTIKRECPFCPAERVLLPNHLPCAGVNGDSE